MSADRKKRYLCGVTENVRVMPIASNSSIEKSFVHFERLPFKPERNQVIFYDSQPHSEISSFVERHLRSIKSFFMNCNSSYEFCYLPEMTKQLDDEQVRYQYPNWNGEPMRRIGNDALKPFLAEENRNIGACFLHLFSSNNDVVFSCFSLKNFSEISLEVQLEDYKEVLDKDFFGDRVMFSISGPESENETSDSSMLHEPQTEYLSYQKRFSYDIEADFEKESEKVLDELRSFLWKVKLHGINEFVLNCAIPVEKRLSRLVVTENYDIILPDYRNLSIELGPMPKAIFLLFLKHEEGIFFKCMSDYRQELERYYRAMTNRITKPTIDSSLDAVTDPTRNILNEKCSVIRKAFVEHMDVSLAENYCITGKRGERKRITLPRNLVEWQCKL